jgi:hypothetical protein
LLFSGPDHGKIAWSWLMTETTGRKEYIWFNNWIRTLRTTRRCIYHTSYNTMSHLFPFNLSINVQRSENWSSWLKNVLQKSMDSTHKRALSDEHSCLSSFLFPFTQRSSRTRAGSISGFPPKSSLSNPPA